MIALKILKDVRKKITNGGFKAAFGGQHMRELKPCNHIFSNGSEYEFFLDSQCYRCTLYRKGHCRTFRMIEKARWEEKYFPYDDLMDYVKYAGKVCKRFTTEKQTRKKAVKKQIDGQLSILA